MQLFNLHCGTERWQSYIPATVLHLVLSLHQFYQSQQSSAKGGFILKGGKVVVRESHLGTSNLTGTKQTGPPGISNGLDFQLVGNGCLQWNQDS